MSGAFKAASGLFVPVAQILATSLPKRKLVEAEPEPAVEVPGGSGRGRRLCPRR
jgi:hypothetical protein